MTDLRIFNDPRAVIVAIDHPLYMWPTPGLEDRRRLIGSLADAGADAFIATYGTIRNFDDAFGQAKRILKMDIKELSVGGYQDGEHIVSWTVEEAQSIGADAVLSMVSIGGPDELQAVSQAARLAAECDRRGVPYLCEMMPVASTAFPDPFAPEAIALCARSSSELGAHAVKTSIPNPPAQIALARGAQLPIYLAGGDRVETLEEFLQQVREAIYAGADGVAVGRNIWQSDDPGRVVELLKEIVRA